MGFVHCEITDDVLTPAKSWELLQNNTQGAIIWFLGNVRDHNEGQKVTAVTYEGVHSLGENVLRKICEECHEKWGADLGLLVSHRVGTLGVGETSIIIGVASSHRVAAYEASRYIIEQVKLRLPIWKKEHYASGAQAWLRGNSLNG
ncbi:molybdenum cofactor biosynthesis protein MoaE [Bdellovibrio sp.]|uniref:molybdenum cofactor biosynthesis protein MoaE n=1 Tax=Bdellovibrio TaxID=958 RepID=UPI003221DE5E